MAPKAPGCTGPSTALLPLLVCAVLGGCAQGALTGLPGDDELDPKVLLPRVPPEQGSGGVVDPFDSIHVGMPGFSPDGGTGGTSPPVEPPPVTPDPMGLAIDEVGSESVSIRWDAAPGATSVRVFIGPEPAAERGDPLPLEREVATLAGDATSAFVERLAPGTDVFVRVAIDVAGEVLSSHVHARTLGGPRAPLDGFVRSVEGFAPSILRVVVANGDGAAWQRGPWTITRNDGTALAVTAVHRHSVPVGAPDYVEGWGRPYTDTVIDADHRLYLVLGAPVGATDLLRLQGPSGIDLTVPVSDRYLETTVVQLNQVGYNPRSSRRYAYVSGWMGSGGALALGAFPSNVEVLAEPSEPWQPRTTVAATLPLTMRSASDIDSGTEVREVDLATVAPSESTRYRVRIPGVGVSFVTQVSERAAFKAYYTVVRGLFHNRWGGDLRSDLTEWTRPSDHPTVHPAEGSDFMTFFPEGTSTAGTRPLVGGYHDAGDFDQRPTHTVVAQLMLRAFELNSDAFTDRQLTLPESGNGIPDMLDEALWGVAGWEALQEADGGVRMGVESTRHPWAFYLANEDPLHYFTYSVNAQVTARAAGLFAQAARLVEPYDMTRSASLRDRALRAYAYATSHGAKPAYRMYASGELLRLTGETRYAADFERAWAEMGSTGAFAAFADHQYTMGDYRADMGTARARVMADFIQGYLGSPSASESIRTTADGQLRTLANQKLVTQNNAHAHRSPCPPSYSLTWGQGTTISRYLDTVIAALQRGGLTDTDRQRYFDALSLAADYLLGANPEGLVFMTGLGSRRVEEPLHLDSLVWQQRGLGPVPGIPVFGLTDSIWQPWSAPAENQFYPQPFENLPRGRRYADVRTVVVTNEFTVWETQAPLAELFGVLVGTGMVPPESWLPGRPDHRNTLP